jgi:hypothetical protein
VREHGNHCSRSFSQIAEHLTAQAVDRYAGEDLCAAPPLDLLAALNLLGQRVVERNLTPGQEPSLPTEIQHS